MSLVSVDLDRALSDLDLDRRLRDVPSTAMTRGVFFNLIEHELRRMGLVLPRWVRPAHGWRSYTFYPTRDWLVAFAHAGALVSADPNDGVRQIFRGGVNYYSTTWFGRTFQRFLRPDPAAALYWIERSREHFATTGYWRIERRAPGHVVLHMFEEYLWANAHRGGCEGLLDACGVRGEVTADIDHRFQGRLDVRWELVS